LSKELFLEEEQGTARVKTHQENKMAKYRMHPLVSTPWGGTRNCSCEDSSKMAKYRMHPSYQPPGEEQGTTLGGGTRNCSCEDPSIK
jgi:hypothetical protein